MDCNSPSGLKYEKQAHWVRWFRYLYFYGILNMWENLLSEVRDKWQLAAVTCLQKGGVACSGLSGFSWPGKTLPMHFQCVLEPVAFHYPMIIFKKHELPVVRKQSEIDWRHIRNSKESEWGSQLLHHGSIFFEYKNSFKAYIFVWWIAKWMKSVALPEYWWENVVKKSQWSHIQPAVFREYFTWLWNYRHPLLNTVRVSPE